MDCKGEYLNARRDTDKKFAKWGCVCIGRTDLHVLPGDPAVLHLACAGSHTGGRCGTGNFFEGCEISWKFRIFR